MDEVAITQYLTATFDDVQIASVDGVTFFFHGAERQFPFVTLVTKDNDYDRASNLDRPSTFRLNIGVSRSTFLALFGAPVPRPKAGCPAETTHDFTSLDRLMPHPVYDSMFWVCVLNPSEATFQNAVRPLLVEAYDRATRKHHGEPPQN